MTDLGKDLPGSAGAALRVVWRSLRRDRLIYLIITVYALGAALLAALLGKLDRLQYLPSLSVWIPSAAILGILYVTFVELPSAVRKSRRAPLKWLTRRFGDLAPAAVRAAALVLALAVFMGAFGTVKTLLPELGGFTWDYRLAELDAWLSGGTDPWRLLQPIMGHHLVTRLVQACYLPIWMAMVCGMPIWAALSPVIALHRIRLLVSYFLCWIVLGNVVAGVFLSAGPAYYGQMVGDHARFQALTVYQAFSHGMPNSSYDLQNLLWTLQEAGRPEFAGGISAFPSLHVSMATLLMIMGFLRGPRAGAAGAMFLAIILAGSVHLGWHYAVDGYAAIILTLAIWFLLKPLDEPKSAT